MENLDLHPGSLLKKAFLEPLGLSTYKLAKDLHLSQTRLGEIIAGKRSISVDTSLRLSKYFQLEDSFWLEAQMTYDIAKTKAMIRTQLDEILPYRSI